MRCDCGCGWEGEDEVAQWLLEEAAAVRSRVLEARAAAEADERVQRDGRLAEMAAGVFRGAVR